ncbi:glycoside hydrolase/deacetylase [Rozella allomycis CSF55]|uniref:Glycoside hydrolase/deacetylase n=1 Tax=Rozella allomycis (strain CSF55) TaxID=988480 RepID=A0A4P9YFB5_ROZAC|nr:glycoside hydrolase/deacetylase [Rozella allomycis CSF55]
MKLLLLLSASSFTLAALPSFTYVASEWPSVAGSTDGLGYTVTAAPTPQILSAFPLPAGDSKLAIKPNSAASTQQCPANVDASLGDTGTCWWTCGPTADPSGKCWRPDDIRDCKGAKTLGLTFDDGPTTFTPTLLQYLVSKNLKATFFLVGAHMVQNPQIVRDLYNAGMEFGVHSWSHHPLTSLTNDQIVAELGFTVQAFQKILGIKPTLFRPPQGDLDDRVRAIAAAMGLRPVMWNLDTNDYTTDGNTNLVAGVVSGFQTAIGGSFSNGLITLEHDTFQGGVDLFENNFLPQMTANGYSLMTVGQCKGIASPTVPSTVNQPGQGQVQQVPSSQDNKAPTSDASTNYTYLFSVVLGIVIAFSMI